MQKREPAIEATVAVHVVSAPVMEAEKVAEVVEHRNSKAVGKTAAQGRETATAAAAAAAVLVEGEEGRPNWGKTFSKKLHIHISRSEKRNVGL